MFYNSFNRHTLSAALVAASLLTASGSANAYAVIGSGTISTTPDVDISFAPGILSALGSVVAVGGNTSSFIGDDFGSVISNVSLSTPGPSAATVTWSPNASFTIANSQAKAVFSGFVLHPSSSEITADIFVTSDTLTHFYHDVGFLIVNSPEVSIGGSSSLNTVSESSRLEEFIFGGWAHFDTPSMSPVFQDLGVPSSWLPSLDVDKAAFVRIDGDTMVTGPASVPEPSTILSFLLGLGMLGGVMLRHRAR